MNSEPAQSTTIVETHNDDAAMFAGHAIRTMVFPGSHCLLTVFSVSEHFNGSYPPQKVPRLSEIAQVRQDEGRAYCRRFRLAAHSLGFADLPLREPENNDSRDRLRRRLENRLRDAVRESTFVVVARPYGEDHHPDHDIVCQAVRAVVASLEAVTLIYADDLPYSRRPLNQSFEEDGVHYVPILKTMSAEDLARKMEAMALYRSQMRPAYFKQVARPAPGDPQHRPSETFWVPNKLHDQFGKTPFRAPSDRMDQAM